MSRKAVCAFALSCALTVPALSVYGKKNKTPTAEPVAAIAQMTEDQKILHALNRLAYGPRPGDVEAVKKYGLDKWIELQLNPQAMPENPKLVAKLAPLDSLLLPAEVMIESYPPPQLIKAMVDGRVPFPEDPLTRMMIRKQVERYNIQDKAKEKKSPQAEAAAKRVAEMSRVPTLQEVVASLTPEQQNTMKSGSVVEKVALMETLQPASQIDLLEALQPQQRQGLFALASPTLRRRISIMNGAQQIVYMDLAEAKMLRATYSNKQLEEVLTDFWFNHFNVFFDKGADRDFVMSYERDAIRPYVLGKFHDMLLATAQHPAMLYYLDNWESVGANSEAFQGNRGRAPKRGLNENYGRELMELHTLGVDGGYSQKDVTEVSRCFTGWTIRNPQRGGQFEFQPRLHDNGEKLVLGVKIPPGGGMDDGLKVLELLAKSPQTAHFISKSLAMRFVSDNPPEVLVERMAKTFLSTDGDLKQVVRTMFTSPEFWSPAFFHAKVKHPFEMMASALRATNAEVDYSFLLSQQLNVMGEPLYRKVEPTGYSLKNADWLNSAALLGRMNFALSLVSNRVPGIKVDLKPYEDATDPNAVAHALLMADLSDNAKKAIQLGVDNPEILQQLNQRSKMQETSMGQGMGPGRGRRGGGMDLMMGAVASNKTALLAGLTLGSPDFQRR